MNFEINLFHRLPVRVTRRFLKNEPTDLKFCTVGRVEVPDTVLQKKFRKIFRLRKTAFFDISKKYPRILTKVPSKDAEFNSQFNQITIRTRTSGYDRN